MPVRSTSSSLFRGTRQLRLCTFRERRSPHVCCSVRLPCLSMMAWLCLSCDGNGRDSSSDCFIFISFIVCVALQRFTILRSAACDSATDREIKTLETIAIGVVVVVVVVVDSNFVTVSSNLSFFFFFRKLIESSCLTALNSHQSMQDFLRRKKNLPRKGSRKRSVRRQH